MITKLESLCLAKIKNLVNAVKVLPTCESLWRFQPSLT